MAARLQEALEELVEHVHGTKVLQQLIHPNRTQCLPPQELALLKLSERSRRVPASQLTEAELVRSSRLKQIAPYACFPADRRIRAGAHCIFKVRHSQ